MDKVFASRTCRRLYNIIMKDSVGRRYRLAGFRWKLHCRRIDFCVRNVRAVSDYPRVKLKFFFEKSQFLISEKKKNYSQLRGSFGCSVYHALYLIFINERNNKRFNFTVYVQNKDGGGRLCFGSPQPNDTYRICRAKKRKSSLWIWMSVYRWNVGMKKKKT